MQEEILDEITTYCNDYFKKERCIENDCVLYRIEQKTLKSNEMSLNSYRRKIIKRYELERDIKLASLRKQYFRLIILKIKLRWLKCLNLV